jgi:hypothetical protein
MQDKNTPQRGITEAHVRQIAAVKQLKPAKLLFYYALI